MIGIACSLSSVSNSPTFAASIRPLRLKSTSPLPVLVIFSIRPLPQNGSKECNRGPNLKIFKTWELIEAGDFEVLAIFRKFEKDRKWASATCARNLLRCDLLRDL